MISDEELAAQIGENFTQHLRVTRVKWRPNEVNENYSVLEGIQWTEEDYERQLRDEMPVITVNKSAPVIDSISGFEIQNRTNATYVPRLTNDEAYGFSDIANIGANYIKNDAKAEFFNSQAFKDMLVCGLGITDVEINYDHNPNGEVTLRRIFPGFFLWDSATREKNGADTEWRAEARPVHKRQLRKLLESWGVQEYDTGDYIPASFDDIEFLRYFDVSLQSGELTVIYNYQWREKETIYRIKNPFYELQNEPLYMNYAASAAKRFKFDPANGIIILTPSDYSKFKKECSSIGIQLDREVNQQRYRYYRCMVIGGRIYKKSENYSQQGFSLQMMTGKYSETDQCYYGIMRAIKPVQRLYNEALSNFQGFLRTIPKGGVNIESDAVDSLPDFLATYAKAKEVTIFKPGALSNGKVQPKIAPPLPPLPEMMQMSQNDIMGVAGVTPDFMGLNDSKEMTGKLQGQLVRQALTVLSEYFDAKKFYTIDQGKLFIDCLRILAENDPGRLIRDITGEGSEKYVPLLLDNIAAEYDVVIEDTPQTPNERQETFEKLLELSGILAQKGVDIIPIALQYAPLKKEEMDKVVQAMQPPPPPEPDPLQQGLLEAEINMRNASATKSAAEAKQIELESVNKIKELAAQTDIENIELQKLQLKAETDAMKLNMESDVKNQTLELEREIAAEEMRLKEKQLQDELKLKYADIAATIMTKRMEIQAKKAEMEALNMERMQEEIELPEEDASMDKMFELAESIKQAVEAMTQPKRVVVTRSPNGTLEGEIMTGGN
jgi:hypothetical protein